MLRNTEERESLGLSERFFYGLCEAGYPRVISFLVTHPNAAVAPRRDFVTRRLDELCKAFPIFNSGVDSGTTPPQWHHGTREPPIGEHQLSICPEETLADLFQKVIELGERLHTKTGPCLRMDFWKPIDPSREEQYVTFTANHVMIDGGGLSTVMSLLLSNDRFPPPDALMPLDRIMTTKDVPPAEAIPDFWPGIPAVSPLDQISVFVPFAIDAGVIQSLRVEAKRHQVTLNPVLEICFIISLWHVMGRPTRPFIGVTNRDERPGCGADAPAFALNYLSVSTTVASPEPSLDVWSMIAERYATLKDPVVIEQGRALLQSTLADPRPLHLNLLDYAKNTPNPFRSSVTFTNLTKVDLPAGALDMHFVSSATPFYSPIICHFLGHERGLRMVMAIRDGAGITAQEATRVASVFGSIIHRLAEGESGSVKDILKEL